MAIVHQGHLLKHLQTLFGVEQTHANARSKTALKYKDSNEYLELDILIQDRNLCFEFQDSYHYVPTWYTQSALVSIQNRDIEKRAIVQQHGLTLVVVPYWWDGFLSSLVASIQFQRPDLLSHLQGTDIIPLNPASEFVEIREVPQIGELMVASFPDPNFKQSICATNAWWMGEKYDGIRSCWNPLDMLLYSRTGRVIEILPEIAQSFPTVFIDSELWFGRGQFACTHTIIKGPLLFVEWHVMRILQFDNPFNFSSQLFEQRYHLLLTTVHPHHPFIITVPRVWCMGEQMCDKAMLCIIEDGGEGIVLRKPSSEYQYGRSLSLFKMKAHAFDTEALVVRKSLLDETIWLQLPSKIEFSVAANDNNFPTIEVGDVVTFTFDWSARNMIPKDPKIIQVRSDLDWNEVVQIACNHNSAAQLSYAEKPTSYWNLQNMRALLESVAKKSKLDPLLPQTWYTLTRKYLQAFKGTEYIFAKFGGYSQAIQTVFKELTFDESQFQIKHGYWSDPVKRRAFFDKFAHDNKFDPLVATNWYSVNWKQLANNSYTHYNNIMQYYQGYKEALVHLYPNIGLEKNKIGVRYPIGFFKKSSNIQEFFSNFAMQHNFDPLVPYNWYSKFCLLKKTKGFYAFKKSHKNIKKMLLQQYPNIGLVKSYLVNK